MILRYHVKYPENMITVWLGDSSGNFLRFCHCRSTTLAREKLYELCGGDDSIMRFVYGEFGSIDRLIVENPVIYRRV